jgi:hypothetical protein
MASSKRDSVACRNRSQAISLGPACRFDAVAKPRRSI